MRGKHANAAATRRDRAELEQRATTAEQRADRLGKELTALRESSERQTTSLRAELAQALKDRNVAAAPALAQAEEQIRGLMTERDAAQERYRVIQGKWDELAFRMTDVLNGMGFTNIEAMEVMLAASMPDGSARTIHDGVRRKGKTAEQIIAVERAQGRRNAVDLLADRKPTA